MFFTRVLPTSCKWKCECDVSRQQKGSGYYNLLKNLSYAHPNKINEARSRDMKSRNGKIPNILFSQNVIAIFDWDFNTVLTACDISMTLKAKMVMHI